MERGAQSVDVICICNADGEIRPLRLRLADERTGWVRVDIDQILRIDRDVRFGSESITFLCGAQIHDRRRILQIKYAVRSHVWSLLSC